MLLACFVSENVVIEKDCPFQCSELFECLGVSNDVASRKHFEDLFAGKIPIIELVKEFVILARQLSELLLTAGSIS